MPAGPSPGRGMPESASKGVESIRFSSYFREVARLRYADLRAMLDFLREAEDVKGTEPFPPHVLERLYGLIPSVETAYCELDYGRRQVLALDTWPPPESPEPDGVEPFFRLADQHPLRHSVLRAAGFRALRMSDVVTRRALRRTEIYAEFFAPVDCEYLLLFRMPSPEWHAKTMFFGRGRGERDFSKRDRAVLDALRPHLARFYEDAMARRRAAAALTAFDEAARCEGPAALVLVGSGGRVEHATAAAHELLREYFGAPAAYRRSSPNGCARRAASPSSPKDGGRG